MIVYGARVFDGREPLDGLFDLHLSEGIITRVAPHAKRLPHAAGEEVVDASGKWALPGLIDLHVHLTWNGGSDPAKEIETSTPEEHLIETLSNALKYPLQGVTSVRDLGSPEDACLFVGRAVERGQIQGPRIFGSGMSLIMTGGHDPFHGLPVDGPMEALKGVRRQVAKGAHVIKISATGGVYGRETGEGVDDIELRPEEIQMIVDEAHRRNVKVTAHAIGESGIRECLKAGIDCIEHGHYIQEDMAEIMRKQNTALVPTFFIYRHLADSDDIPPYARAKAARVVEQHRKALRLAKEKGVLIGAGSDAGSPQAPHPCLVEEILALEEGGLSGLEALRAATANAGAILGLADRLGVIAEGAFADLLLVGENPLEDLNVLRNPTHVIARGRVVK